MSKQFSSQLSNALVGMSTPIFVVLLKSGVDIKTENENDASVHKLLFSVILRIS